MRGSFCSFVLRIHCSRVTIHYVVIDSIFYIGSVIRRAKDPFFIRLILGEQEFMVSMKVHVTSAERATRCGNSVVILLEEHLLEQGLGYSITPRPGVAKPEGR